MQMWGMTLKWLACHAINYYATSAMHERNNKVFKKNISKSFNCLYAVQFHLFYLSRKAVARSSVALSWDCWALGTLTDNFLFYGSWELNYPMIFLNLLRNLRETRKRSHCERPVCPLHSNGSYYTSSSANQISTFALVY